MPAASGVDDRRVDGQSRVNRSSSATSRWTRSGGRSRRNSLTATRRSPVRIVGAKDRAQCAGANLMKNPEWTEGVGRGETRSVRVQ